MLVRAFLAEWVRWSGVRESEGCVFEVHAVPDGIRDFSSSSVVDVCFLGY